MKYFEALESSMTWLGNKDNTVFIGQSIVAGGTFMTGTFKNVSKDKMLEFPVSESFQMQFCLGVALAGQCVIAVYPRQNFLLLATGDMVNMVDKVKDISNGQINPHLIIRVAIGPDTPVHPGHQHINDYSFGLQSMFKHICVLRIEEPDQALPIYEFAYNNPGQYLIIETGNFYGLK